MNNTPSSNLTWVATSRALIEKAQLGPVMRGQGCRVHPSLADKLYGVLTVHAPVELAASLEVNMVSLGAYSYLSEGCVAWNVQIANYVSIARECLLGMAGHPLDWLSPSPAGYMRFFNEHAPDYQPQASFGFFPKPTVIEDSVWLGARVIVPGNRDIRIGRGAVVAAGSVVTRDIPAYAVAVGSPAKVLRMRFDEPTMDALEASGWWKYDVAKLQAHGILLDFSKPLECVHQLRDTDPTVLDACLFQHRRLQMQRQEDKILVVASEGRAG